MSWAITSRLFRARGDRRRAVGWLIIRPVNAVLGWLFRGFNRLFDVVTAVYGWTVGKLLRLSAVVLLVYGGLVALTYWVFQHAPTGFIPQQDQGRLIVGVQLPDSASLQRTQEAMAQVDKITRETPGVAHAVAHLGNVVSAAVQRLQLRLDVHRARAVRRAAEARAARRRHHGPAAAASITEAGQGRDRERVGIPRRSRAWASPAASRSWSRTVAAAGWRVLQTQTDDLTAELQQRPGLAGVATQFRSNTPQLYLDIDRTKAEALGVSFEDVNQTLSMFLGSLYVNSFNAVRPALAGHRPARGDIPQPDRGYQPAPGPQQYGQMVPMGTLVNVREDRRPDRRHAL